MDISYRCQAVCPQLLGAGFVEQPLFTAQNGMEWTIVDELIDFRYVSSMTTGLINDRW